MSSCRSSRYYIKHKKINFLVDSSFFERYCSFIGHLYMKDNLSQDQFNVLRKINKKQEISQRSLAKDLNISLGKLNYVIRELRIKGLIKLNSFKNNPSKIILSDSKISLNILGAKGNLLILFFNPLMRTSLNGLLRFWR